MSSIEEPDALQIARALGDPHRFAIYRYLAETGEIRCRAICINSPVRAATVSHHLKVLAEAGLIRSRSKGQGVYYSTVPERLNAYLKYLRTLKRTEEVLQRDS